MNAIGMIFQQVMLTKGNLPQHSSKGMPADKQTVFQNLITSLNAGVIKNNQNETQVKMTLINMLMSSSKIKQLAGTEISKEHAMKILEGIFSSIATGQGNSASEEALKILEDTFGSIVMKQDSQTTKEAVQALAKIMEKVAAGQGSKAEVSTNSEMNATQLVFFNQAAPEIMNDKTLQKQLEGLLAKAEKLISQITDQKSLTKTAPALLKLLEQWSALEKKFNTQSNMVPGSLQNNSKEQAIWKELLQAYQKRNQLAVKQQYNTSAKVTTTDVTKWLQHAVSNQAKMDSTTAQQSMTFTSSVPLSKVEQYAIHMNQNQTTQQAGQQLIEQFQKVMKTSRFLTMQNGTSQLNITLRPENLGDMMVKLTQINGEMTVKIMVTSHAAKEMLEANMHQLKNMFSPQQVVVEKQEVTSQQAQSYQSEQEEQSMDGQDQGDSNHSEQNDDNHSDEDFESQFQKALMNEKV
ncbi:flagellar hook-length control protein FliK [Virgibacillus doumboii]|uniref:flagellar hook-length control protein FliK n=1 Tax=Virgibacillus doumboii TaxID=2697503 RepID=UPI0013DFAC96|nr:flagellar hook-length control protein FliK [Virgibacillus doumboii]